MWKTRGPVLCLNALKDFVKPLLCPEPEDTIISKLGCNAIKKDKNKYSQ